MPTKHDWNLLTKVLEELEGESTFTARPLIASTPNVYLKAITNSDTFKWCDNYVRAHLFSGEEHKFDELIVSRINFLLYQNEHKPTWHGCVALVTYILLLRDRVALSYGLEYPPLWKNCSDPHHFASRVIEYVRSYQAIRRINHQYDQWITVPILKLS